MTQGAMEALDDAGELPSKYILRHCYGDWGDVDAHDAAANQSAMKTGDRILSAYKTGKGAELWVITDAIDITRRGAKATVRHVTTIMRPSEY